jgi:hypothetical protein
MRFGRNQRSPAEESAWNDLWDTRPAQHQAPAPAAAPASPAAAAAAVAQAISEPAIGPEGRELFVRHARKDGKMVAILRAIDFGTSCVVQAEVSPQGTNQLVKPGPYTFPDAHQASAFVTEAVAALMYLGCDVQAV